LTDLFPEPARREWTARAAKAGVAAVAVLVAVHVLDRLTVESQFLDLNGEQNLQSWASTFAFSLAGILALGAGLEHRIWLAVGAIMLALSIDDVAMLHERMEEHVDGGVALLLIEPLAALAVLAVFALAARTVHGLSRALLIGGLVALVVAQGTSSAGFLRDELDLPLALLVVVEETAELLVGVLVAAAAVDPLLAAVDAAGRLRG